MIKYKLLENILKRQKIKNCDFLACSSGDGNYKLIRAQMKAKFLCTAENGPIVKTEEHDKKCMAVIDCARNEHAELLLFPEYCISYKVLKKIIKNSVKWPDYGMLWCFPCQGIKTNAFFKFIQDIEKDENVIVIKDAINENNIHKRNFINVFFYCFIGDISDTKKLILVPQLKTQHMADRKAICEADGMTTGSVIYIIGNSKNNYLLTLLCADSLNSQIIWDDIKRKTCCRCITILHPQLNQRPKQDTFAGIRKRIFEFNINSIQITCNWAADTEIIMGDDEHFEKQNLALSWSCIYCKSDLMNHYYLDKCKYILQNNADYFLYGALMREKKVMVWYTASDELVHSIQIQKPSADNYSIVKIDGIIGKKSFVFSENGKMGEKKNSYSFQKVMKKLPAEYLDFANFLLQNEHYKPALECQTKEELDLFFAMISLDKFCKVYEIDKDENLFGWSLLLTDEEVEKARTGFQNWSQLINYLNNQMFSGFLLDFKDNYEFQYVKEDEKKGLPFGNFTQKNGEKRLIMGVSPDCETAERYIDYLQKELKDYFGGDEGRIAYAVCIWAKDLKNGGIIVYPKNNISIFKGDIMRRTDNIADGGSEDD